MEDLIVVLPAAGSGKRLGLGMNKAFVKIDGVPSIVYNLNNLSKISAISRVIIPMRKHEVKEATLLLESYQKQYYPQLSWELAIGGDERQNSVANALAKIDDNYEGYVAVHDGARIFCDEKIFLRVFDLAKEKGAAIAGIAVKDTIKIVDENSAVIDTPDRSKLMAIQTPQIFKAKLLKKAYNKVISENMVITDDSSAVEALGVEVFVAKGEYYNIKITSPEDLKWASYYLNK